MPRTDTARPMPAALRQARHLVGATAPVAVFTVAAAGVWFVVVVFLGLAWSPSDVAESTLTGDETAIIYGLATAAALVTRTPGLVLAYRFVRW